MNKQREHGNFNIKIVSFVTMSLLLSVVPALESRAQVFADSTCDSTYYDALEARAWLEAQREITQNQNLIFKPDSVLEYTCFDSHLNQMANASSNLFSGMSRWGGGENMASALGSVASANRNYDLSNFHYESSPSTVSKYLSHRSDQGSLPPSASVSNSSYSCDVMKKVWESAKCMDFLADASHDGFFTFAEYAAESNDKRFKPSQCSPFAAKSEFESNIKKVYGTAAETPWEEDPVRTYFYLFDRGTGADICGNSPNAAVGAYTESRIKTGLTVKTDVGGVNEYEEYICLVPGCYYEPSSLTSGTCKLPS